MVKRFTPKPLSRQAIVITGATSGIGLATARMAAKSGAAVFLIARSEAALRALTRELSTLGIRVEYSVADVGVEAEIASAAQDAARFLGQYDTWINCAGVSIYGPADQVPTGEQRRLFDTNYWGTVYGSLAAVKHLRDKGGTIINLGSELSDVPVQLQSAYVASKHAVKGFTNSLRLELQSGGMPILISLIKPAGTDTLFVEHARKHVNFTPKLPPPVYAPEVVAKAILHAAQHDTRDLYAGGASKGMSILGEIFPRTYDLLLKVAGIPLQRSNTRESRGPDGLREGAGNLMTRSGKNGDVLEHSLYSFITRRPILSVVGIAALAALALSASKSGDRNP